MRLTSTANPVVKYVRSLESPVRRRDDGVYLIEGIRLVEEAVRAGVRARIALYIPDALQRSALGQRILSALAAGWADSVYEVDERVLRAAANTEHPGGVVAAIPIGVSSPLHVHAEAGLGLILDGVADPGNAGTILRRQMPSVRAMW